MPECLFCKIAKGDIPSYRIWEDKEFVAFLDIFPNIRGQTLVIPKEHYESNSFHLDDEVLVKLIKAAKRVSGVLEKGLDVQRVHMVLEGTGVNHLHAKLYPAIGIRSREFKEIIANEKRHFDAYPGYVTTLMGEKASDDELKTVQKQIIGE
ncbi:MAG: HIT domain-containing protein [Candidatus Micrarchaeota archaeon]|nr:HIT domain-containing protein [Candidatus Micrarchaeota archaeon]MDE1804722.1 HIT domain-containing protein [Candidatus Micrarchaeota archaeon]MDE1847067.1 HIT domain-containing protein [Candidatus Micrarchaeota archaeon]